MNKAINETKVHYEKMMYKEALKTGFFEYQVNKYLCLSVTCDRSVVFYGHCLKCIKHHTPNSYNWIVNKSYRTGVSIRATTSYSTRAPGFTNKYLLCFNIYSGTE
jgi:hypothetical protein